MIDPPVASATLRTAHSAPSSSTGPVDLPTCDNGPCKRGPDNVDEALQARLDRRVTIHGVENRDHVPQRQRSQASHDMRVARSDPARQSSRLLQRVREQRELCR